MDVKRVELRIHRRRLLHRRLPARDVAGRHADHPRVIEQMRIARPRGEGFRALAGRCRAVAFFVKRPRQRIVRKDALPQRNCGWLAALVDASRRGDPPAAATIQIAWFSMPFDTANATKLPLCDQVGWLWPPAGCPICVNRRRSVPPR